MGGEPDTAVVDLWPTHHRGHVHASPDRREYDGSNVLLCPLCQGPAASAHRILLDRSHHPAHLSDSLPLYRYLVGIPQTVVLGPIRLPRPPRAVKPHEGGST
jgi:hypothetical protein